MNGIFGVVAPREGGLIAHALQLMAAKFSSWTQSSAQNVFFEAAGLGLICVPDSSNVVPLVLGSEGQRLTIVADIRLDNREELIRILTIGSAAAPVSDSEILLAAYSKWAEKMPQYLLGDFVFALWDEARERSGRSSS